MELAIAMGIIGCIGFFMGVWALIEVKAMQKSTHKIQWMPLDDQKSSFDDKTPLDGDNQEIDDIFTSDELFADDIDLYLDPPRKRKPKPKDR